LDDTADREDVSKLTNNLANVTVMADEDLECEAKDLIGVFPID